MADVTDRDIDAALRLGEIAAATEPRAVSARYDPQFQRVMVDLSNGCLFAFPPRLAQGLEAADDEQLACIEILGGGYGLRWDALDVDLSLPGLLAGIFGTKTYLARRAGQARSAAKAAAARVNGAKGGRPLRQQ